VIIEYKVDLSSAHPFILHDVWTKAVK